VPKPSPEEAVRADIDRFLHSYDSEVSSREPGHSPSEPSHRDDLPDINKPASLTGAGILRSFPNRREALERFNPTLREAQKVVVVGSSLKGLIHPDGAHPETCAILRERVSRQQADAEGQLVTNFMLTHPAFADLRAEQENRAKQDIGLEIIQSLMYLRAWGAEAKSIHLYLGTPTCFGIMADKQMILNPYTYADVAFQSPCLMLDDSGYFYTVFARSHFGILDRTMVVRLSDLFNDIGDLHFRLGEFQQRTDELLTTARNSTYRPPSQSETESDLEQMPGFKDIKDKARKRYEELHAAGKTEPAPHPAPEA
jgi:hypothetical protein